MGQTLNWERDGHDWPHRDCSHFVRAGGLRWHLQRWGATKAPLALLLHGTGASTHSWRALAPLLASGYRVVAMDLPGHGFTQALPPARCTLPDMALALAALMQAEQLQPHLALGHSAGAALMLRLSLDGHLPHCSLIGLNAALLPFGGRSHFLYASMARFMAASGVVPRLAAWRARDPAAVRRMIDATGSTLDAEGVALYGRLLRSPAHVAQALSMMANWDLEALQRELPAAQGLHLLVGERDTAVPPVQAERVAARVPQTVVHRLPGLGHLAHEEAPQRVARLVLDISRPARATAPD